MEQKKDDRSFMSANSLVKYNIKFVNDAKPLSTGGSGICYLVKRNERFYVLKEYYPINCCYFIRNQQSGLLQFSNHISPEEKEKRRDEIDCNVMNEVTIANKLALHRGKKDNSKRTRTNSDTFFMSELLRVKETDTRLILMDTFSGMTLDAWESENKLVEESIKLDILIKLLKRTKEMHESSIMHFDLKPQNIFVTESGNVILLDFGSALDATESYDKDRFVHSTIALGTMGYRGSFARSINSLRKNAIEGYPIVFEKFTVIRNKINNGYYDDDIHAMKKIVSYLLSGEETDSSEEFRKRISFDSEYIEEYIQLAHSENYNTDDLMLKKISEIYANINGNKISGTSLSTLSTREYKEKSAFITNDSDESYFEQIYYSTDEILNNKKTIVSAPRGMGVTTWLIKMWGELLKKHFIPIYVDYKSDSVYEVLYKYGFGIEKYTNSIGINNIVLLIDHFDNVEGGSLDYVYDVEPKILSVLPEDWTYIFSVECIPEKWDKNTRLCKIKYDYLSTSYIRDYLKNTRGWDRKEDELETMSIYDLVRTLEIYPDEAEFINHVKEELYYQKVNLFISESKNIYEGFFWRYVFGGTIQKFAYEVANGMCIIGNIATYNYLKGSIIDFDFFLKTLISHGVLEYSEGKIKFCDTKFQYYLAASYVLYDLYLYNDLGYYDRNSLFSRLIYRERVSREILEWVGKIILNGREYIYDTYSPQNEVNRLLSMVWMKPHNKVAFRNIMNMYFSNLEFCKPDIELYKNVVTENEPWMLELLGSSRSKTDFNIFSVDDGLLVIDYQNHVYLYDGISNTEIFEYDGMSKTDMISYYPIKTKWDRTISTLLCSEDGYIYSKIPLSCEISAICGYDENSIPILGSKEIVAGYFVNEMRKVCDEIIHTVYDGRVYSLVKSASSFEWNSSYHIQEYIFDDNGHSHIDVYLLPVFDDRVPIHFTKSKNHLLVKYAYKNGVDDTLHKLIVDNENWYIRYDMSSHEEIDAIVLKDVVDYDILKVDDENEYVIMLIKQQDSCSIRIYVYNENISTNWFDLTVDGKLMSFGLLKESHRIVVVTEDERICIYSLNGKKQYDMKLSVSIIPKSLKISGVYMCLLTVSGEIVGCDTSKTKLVFKRIMVSA